MAPVTITLRLNPNESKALEAAALQNLRSRRAQAHVLLRQSLGLSHSDTLEQRIDQLTQRIEELELEVQKLLEA